MLSLLSLSLLRIRKKKNNKKKAIKREKQRKKTLQPPDGKTKEEYWGQEHGSDLNLQEVLYLNQFESIRFLETTPRCNCMEAKKHAYPLTVRS